MLVGRMQGQIPLAVSSKMLCPTSARSVVLGLHSGNSMGFPLCCCLAGCQVAREHEAGSREAEAPAQGCPLPAGTRWESLPWAGHWEGLPAGAQRLMEWMFLTGKQTLWSEMIPWAGMYLAPVLRKLGWNCENHKLFCFVFFFIYLEIAETQETRIHWDRRKSKRLSLFSCILLPALHCALPGHTLRSVTSPQMKEHNSLSFYTMKADRLVWHQTVIQQWWPLYKREVFFKNKTAVTLIKLISYSFCMMIFFLGYQRTSQGMAFLSCQCKIKEQIQQNWKN